MEQLLKLPVSQKVMLFGLIGVLMGFFFWQFHYSSQQDELAAQRQRETMLRQKLLEVQKREKTYDEDLQRREDLKIASVKQREMLPTTTEMASFLNNLNTVADLTGLRILSIKPLEAELQQYYARIPVALELEGSYLQLAKFFYQVGKLDRIINIENISLKVAEITDSGTTLRASVRATTFRALESGK